MDIARKLSYLLVAAVCLAAGWYGAKWNDRIDPSSMFRGDVLATVGDTVIDLTQYQSAMRRYGGSRPGQYRTLDQKRALLDRLIKQAVLVSAALDAGLDKDPEVLNVWNELLADRYAELNLRPRLESIHVSQQDMEAYYSENQRKYIRPERRRAALILRRIPRGADATERRLEREKIEQAEASLAGLDGGLTHFGTVATEFSHERASRYVGGVIGWFVKHPDRSYKWNQAVIDALFDLDDVGDISPVIELPDGYALVRLVDREAQQEKAYAAVSKGVRNKLLHERQLREKEAFKAELAARVAIEINEDLLASIAPLSGEAIEQEQKPPALPSG